MRVQAERLGVGYTTFRNWLNGTAKWPKSAQEYLENWSWEPMIEDTDELRLMFNAAVPADDERALIAAWKKVRSDDISYNLACTVADWDAEDLASIVRNKSDDSGFQELVNMQLLDQETDTYLYVPESVKHVLYEKAYQWVVPAMLERFVKLLDKD
jgi:hypothetical protein